MGALKVDAFSSSIGSDQNLHIRIVLERLLHLRSFFASHAAMDRDDCFLSSEKRGNSLFEIAQGVAVLGKDDQLLAR